MLREALFQVRRLGASRGTLILGPRPGKKTKKAIAAQGITHICTLLSEREHATAVQRIDLDLGIRWVWLPVAGGGMEVLAGLDVEHMIIQLGGAICETPSPRIYLHCSAGIHRTGFFVSLLLRLE